MYNITPPTLPHIHFEFSIKSRVPLVKFESKWITTKLDSSILVTSEESDDFDPMKCTISINKNFEQRIKMY